jgi:hypothetical protein
LLIACLCWQVTPPSLAHMPCHRIFLAFV